MLRRNMNCANLDSKVFAIVCNRHFFVKLFLCDCKIAKKVCVIAVAARGTVGRRAGESGRKCPQGTPGKERPEVACAL